MIRATSTTKVRDENYKRFLREMKKIKGSYVTIGVHDKAEPYPDGQAVVQVAFWNEFGTVNIPERSFLRAAIDANMGQINRWREDLIRRVSTLQMTTELALESLGFRVCELVKNQIRRGSTPPPYGTGTHGNSAERIEYLQELKRKEHGHIKTLEATGHLLLSITYDVHVGGA